MNELQAKTFEYLSSGSADRRSALNDLLDDGFFNTDTELQESIDFLHDYADDQEANDAFCTGGINRFRENVLDGFIRATTPEGTGPRTDTILLGVEVVITHDKGNPNDAANITDYRHAVIDQIETGLGLLAGNGWAIDTADIVEWEVR